MTSKLEELPGYHFCQNTECPHERISYPRKKMVQLERLLFCSQECANDWSSREEQSP